MTDQHEPALSSPASAIGGSEVKKLGYSLYLRIPDNRLECRCSYVPHEQGSMMNRDDLAAFMKQYSVLEGIDQQAIDGFVVRAAAGQQQVDVLLASGTPPVAGADEKILLSMQPSSTVRSGEEGKTNVDMYIVQTFVNVSAGDEIGRIIPAGPGTPGRNISGMPIAAQPGKPLHVTIGKNIRIEENGTLLIAAATGRLCQSAGEISVEEEYVVKGDVNFRIGSIDFKGIVEVRGDVLDNFGITASKGLTVTGNIGACNIVSDGDVIFCGMDGQERGRIICGGTLRVNFIHDVEVECVGDVIVGVEIHNCIIRTLGRIVVDKGAISGGSCIALGGIEAKKLGSASSLRTNLVAGVDYRDVEELDGLFAELAKNQAAASVSQSLVEIEELRNTKADLTDRVMAIRARAAALANAKINAKTVLYENVQMSIGNASETINEKKDGPLSVIENSIEGGFRFLPMTSLDVKAADIELASVEEQEMALRKE